MNLVSFLKKNAFVCVSFTIALISAFFVFPDKEYLAYFDYKTLSTLFFMLIIVTGLSYSNFFQFISMRIVVKFHNIKLLIFILVLITFLGSIIIANDMALITFLPLGYYVLKDSGNEKHMAYTFIMQNIAANLGGMITPFGNPQNLYLYSYFSINFIDFVLTMLPYFLMSIFLMFILTIIFVKKSDSNLKIKDVDLDEKAVVKYGIMFVLFLLIIFNIVPFYIGFIIPIFVFFDSKKEIMGKVDYNLLFTFVFFFVFTGNIARIDAVNNLLGTIEPSNIFIVSVLSCQFISNVPTAILMSKFTTNYFALLVAVNVGGVGTLVASLASLITFKEYNKRFPKKSWNYIKKFSLINFLFLGILILLYYIINL